MKKFLKWSAAFLVLGVLAVGCIKNEPSPGIEAMRNAKAALLTAQAALEQAKVQVEAANAALIQAQASVIKAHEAIIAAQARKVDAETALIMAQVEWEKALTDYHKQQWALNIQEREYELEVARAAADAAIKEWEVYMVQLQAQMVAATQAYEAALLQFELWKLANADTISDLLMFELDKVVLRIKGVLLQIAQAQLNLDFAKSQYLWYVNIEYPQEVENAMLHWEFERKLLICKVEHMTGVVAAYEALYNAKHEEFDALIADFQATINALREAIVDYELQFITLEEEYLLFDHDGLAAAKAALTKKRTVSISGVFSDGGDDPNIHVNNGTYKLSNWGWQAVAPAVTMFDIMKRDMRVIDDTRKEFEDQESGVIQRNLDAKKKLATDAETKYKENWNNWQKYYKEGQPGAGARYTAWLDAWNAWNTANQNFLAHQTTYENMYYEADSLIRLFMNYLDGWLNLGNLEVPSTLTLSQVLGGIEFNAGTLADWLLQGNADDVFETINVIIGLINAPTEMDAIITQLKGIMDGTHPDGFPPFWQHATAWPYEKTPYPFNDIMRKVYANSDKELTDLTKEDWYAWLFLYWLFESRTVEIGLENPNGGSLITINAAEYTDAAQEVLEDFFGELTPKVHKKIVKPDPGVAYTGPYYVDYMKGTGTKALENAIKAYFDAVEGLGNMETAMYDPFDRVWKAYAKHKDANGGVEFEMTRTLALGTYLLWKPFLTRIAPTPGTYNPPTYNDTPDLTETQPAPIDFNQFFFVLEAYKDYTSPSPSLDFDITYLDDDCNLIVSYAALKAAGDDCGKQWSEWVGDMLLWEWDGPTYANGHYFYAIYQARQYQAYLDTWTRVDNGEYEALIGKIQALYDAQLTAFNSAKAYAASLQAELDAIEDGMEEAQDMIEAYECYIDEYEWLIAQAMMAHDFGNWLYTDADGGLLDLWEDAKHQLMELQQDVAAIEQIMALLEQGLPAPDLWGDLIQDRTVLYQAKIDAILLDIENLQQKLAILEGIRAKLLEDYL
ncbi:MAG TPA: hypothetical protein PLV18_00005 [Bacteroidales bacterium]|nr:hypothetical protein [Bacteroidales bacterium]